LPDLPTTPEAGIPNSDYDFWVGMIGARQDRARNVTKLHQNTAGGAADAAHAGAHGEARCGADAHVSGFDAYIKKEIASNAALVKAAGIAVK
jgi:tripartite-type tricarboxylate transporter receptor subunit TctC